jgi:hypothetical protein
VQSKLGGVPVTSKHFLADIRLLQAEPFFENVTWEELCKRVTRTPFLMGKNNGNSQSDFKVTLSWILKPKNARKVLEGHFYTMAEPETFGDGTFKEKPWTAFVAMLKAEQKRLKTSSRWFEASKVLGLTLGQAKWQDWFKELKVKEIPATSDKPFQITFKAPNTFVAKTLTHHHPFPEALKKSVKAAYPEGTTFSISVIGSTALPDLNSVNRPVKGRDQGAEIPQLQSPNPLSPTLSPSQTGVTS